MECDNIDFPITIDKEVASIMPVIREHLSARSKELLNIVDDIFDVFEQVRAMFQNWHADYHMPFIEQVMKLQKLEAELYTLGYDEDFVLTVKQVVYSFIFAKSDLLPLVSLHSIGKEKEEAIRPRS